MTPTKSLSIDLAQLTLDTSEKESKEFKAPESLRQEQKEVISPAPGDFPWMTEGKFITKPLQIKTSPYELDRHFFSQSLATKALPFLKEYLPKEQISRKFSKYVSTSLREGTCYGQSCALMIAYSQQLQGKKGRLLDLINRSHIIFFQIMANVSACYRTVVGTKTTFKTKEPGETVSLAQLKSLAGMERTQSMLFDFYNPDEKKKFIDTFMTTPEKTFAELTFYKKEAANAHSCAAIIEKAPISYDIQVGLVQYNTRDQYLKDFLTKFDSDQKLGNPPRYLSCQFFRKIP